MQNILIYKIVNFYLYSSYCRIYYHIIQLKYIHDNIIGISAEKNLFQLYFYYLKLCTLRLSYIEYLLIFSIAYVHCPFLICTYMHKLIVWQLVSIVHFNCSNYILNCYQFEASIYCLWSCWHCSDVKDMCLDRLNFDTIFIVPFIF